MVFLQMATKMNRIPEVILLESFFKSERLFLTKKDYSCKLYEKEGC